MKKKLKIVLDSPLTDDLKKTKTTSDNSDIRKTLSYFHFFISAFGEKKSQCSELIVTFSLRRNGNFICENLIIQTFYPFYFDQNVFIVIFGNKSLLKVLLSESLQHV